jgi:hypothetical protein
LQPWIPFEGKQAQPLLIREIRVGDSFTIRIRSMA